MELTKGVEVFSLIGLDYRAKIAYCDSVDFFIANAGTGCIVPLRFVKKPGVLHSNTQLFTFPNKYPEYVKFIGKDFVIDVVHENKRIDYLSYHVPWQLVFNLSADVLRLTKGVEIKKISIPTVIDIKKDYEQRSNPQ